MWSGMVACGPGIVGGVHVDMECMLHVEYWGSVCGCGVVDVLVDVHLWATAYMDVEWWKVVCGPRILGVSVGIWSGEHHVWA